MKACVGGGETRAGGRECQADSLLSAESEVGLDLTILSLRLELKPRVGCLLTESPRHSSDTVFLILVSTHLFLVYTNSDIHIFSIYK